MGQPAMTCFAIGSADDHVNILAVADAMEKRGNTGTWVDQMDEYSPNNMRRINIKSPTSSLQLLCCSLQTILKLQAMGFAGRFSEVNEDGRTLDQFSYLRELQLLQYIHFH